jgi:hypothetical protein
MTDTQELNALIQKARELGAIVGVTYDVAAWKEEGRVIHESIQVLGLDGIGPFPMGPITAAELLRPAVHRN